ncbi:MAG TPA: DUF4412 domain-containing protein [Pyrinomonadaceae bacterium]|nr:DUF4412 domain-containing protein [Pyrinomonadaceae bacterium]
MRLTALTRFFLLGVVMQGASIIIGPFIMPAGVKDRPFQGEFELVTRRRSAGGEVSRRVTRGAIYRDASGRSRREEYASGGAGKIIKAIIIHDPAKHEGYLLDPESKTFFTMPTQETTGRDRSGTSEPSAELPTFDGEDIGRKVIDGLACRGYRRNGSGGAVIEYWVAEELLEAVWARIVDGDNDDTLRVFDIHRVEPDEKLFTVPADYQPVDIK